MSISGDGSERREPNHLLQGENKRDEDAVFSDDFEVNDPAETIKYRHDGALQDPSAALETSQQQDSQGSVCWERFLHLRSLKVLLVENDYSTRHVVTALLRSCSYEVTEAANGLQAWKILEDPTNQIDLVLTEVVMPGLSGMGLLHEIMSHNTRNNVPVIMMSSNDSMGTVFKCLSKGAVDFLVKPIRKNELKNLWQHVWRRCHSSSGSGSESDTQTQKSVKSKGVEKYDNDYGGDDEYDNGSMGLNVGDGSDNGSGTQGYWTKQAVDMDAPQSASVKDQVAIFPDSTCAQVLHSNTEVSGNKQTPIINIKMCAGCDEELDDATFIDKERVVGKVDIKSVHQAVDPTKIVGTKQKHILEKGSGKLKEKTDEVYLNLKSEAPPNTLCCAANLTGSTANTVSPFTKEVGIEVSIRQSRISNLKTKALNDAKYTPSFEHDLKRLREDNDVGTAVQEDRNVLMRSDSSPFSRYNTLSNANKDVGVNIISGCPPDCTLDKTKEGLVRNLQSHSNGDRCNQSSNIDMGSTTNHIIPESIILQNISTASSSAKHLHPPSAFQPSTGDLLFATQQIQSKEPDDAAIRKMLVQSSDIVHDHMCQCLARNYNHQNMPHQNCCQQPELPSEPHDASLKKMAATMQRCGSSNVFCVPIEGNCGNYISLNRSASGSNQGSNELNGISTAVNTGGVNLENDNGIAGKNGNGSGNGHMPHQNKFSQIKAVLTKFRQKKKERCFRKKVRCNSREKRLVRKTTNNSSSKKTES